MASIEQKLCTAVRSRNIDAVQTLLARKDVKLNGNLGRSEWTKMNESPLYCAVVCGYDEIISVLLKAGFNINSSIGSYICNGTALHWAVYSDKVSIVQMLLDYGADMMLEGNYDLDNIFGTPAQWAKSKGFAIYRKIFEEEIEKRKQPQSMQSLIKKVESKHLKAETLAKALKIKNLIDLKEKKREKLLKDITSLKADPDYKTNETIKELQDEMDEIEKLVSAVQKSLEPGGKSEDINKSCKVCMEITKRVYICLECENWVCRRCKKQLENCPHCRVELKTNPLQRSKAVEKALGLHL